MISKIENIDMIINATSVGFNLWQRNKTGYFNQAFFSPVGILKN